MINKISFYNRDKELQQLCDNFKETVLKEKKCLSYLIQGRLHVGKSRLIREFIDRIENELIFSSSEISNFKREKQIIEYNCLQENSEPYLPFIKITQQIRKNESRWRILSRIFMIMISLLPLNIHDLLEDLQKFSKDIESSDTDKKTILKKKKIFQRYQKFLRSLCTRSPLIIHIQNVQWIDKYSLQLIESLIDPVDKKQFWGMIIFEENEVSNADIGLKHTFTRLIDKNIVQRMTIKPLQKGFETVLLENLFGDNFFTAIEYEYIYSYSKGYPGLLLRYIETWKNNGWIYQDGFNWKKISTFEEKIKPPYRKLLDLIIRSLQDDGKISAKEKRLIENLADELDIEHKTVSTIIEILIKCRESGYEIEERVHSGSMGKDAFLAYDKNRNRYIIEYISKNKDLTKEVIPKDVTHPRLLPVKEIIKTTDGLIIVNDFFDGKTLKEIKEEAQEIHINNVLQTGIQIVEGLAELHRNKFIHGFLRPESIIYTNEGDIRIAAIDAIELNLTKKREGATSLTDLPYFSPEQIEGKEIDKRSDIFSFGVLLYEMLTNELPFKGSSIKEIKEKIRICKLPDFNKINPAIPVGIQNILMKCLQHDPVNRYVDTHELLRDLKEQFVPAEGEIKPPDDDLKIDPSNPENGKLKKKIVTVAFFVMICAIGIAWWLYDGSFVDNTIVIENFKTESRSSLSESFNSDMVNYLIVDALLQSSNKIILSDDEFDLRFGTSKRPEIRMKGEILFDDIQSEINIHLITKWRNKKYPVIQFADPSSLLTGKINGLSREIIHQVGGDLRKSTFTRSWDAFKNFFNGEIAWERLEITQAERLFKAALFYDNSFVLAKLRLAQVLRFNGSNLEAIRLINEIQPYQTQLGELDSLRADALRARLTGNLPAEIEILRSIYNIFPTRKECAYEVAEAYYEICEINNAIEYYRRTLRLDENFAKAHNHLGYCYTHTGDHAKALRHFRTYTSLDSTANSFDSIGDGFFAAGKLDSAEWAKKSGIGLDPNLSYLYGSLTYINIWHGKLAEAANNIDKYLGLVSGNDNISGGKFRLALIEYTKKNYSKALAYCQEGLQLYDSSDITTRPHDLHWLAGVLYTKLNNPTRAQVELSQMSALIEKHNIGVTNYRQELLKYYYHLKACIAAKNGNIDEMTEIINLFDSPIKNKIKDHTSPFDLAFFNTSFAELFIENNRYNLATDRLNRALEYNRDYAMAHYNLWQVYKRQNDNQKSDEHRDRFRDIWQNADPVLLNIYN